MYCIAPRCCDNAQNNSSENCPLFVLLPSRASEGPEIVLRPTPPKLVLLRQMNVVDTPLRRLYWETAYGLHLQVSFPIPTARSPVSLDLASIVPHNSPRARFADVPQDVGSIQLWHQLNELEHTQRHAPNATIETLSSSPRDVVASEVDLRINFLPTREYFCVHLETKE